MTIDDFWQKYNHCPKCKWYVHQKMVCDICKWYLPIREHDPEYLDNFDPTDDAISAMNAEIDEWR